MEPPAFSSLLHLAPLDGGIPNKKIYFVGNTMVDSLLLFNDKADTSVILDKLRLRSGTGTSSGVARYALLTLDRPSNVDHRATF